MAQRVFSFHSPVDEMETIDIITNVISQLKGKTKVSGNKVTAKWWCKSATFFPHKFTFFIGKNIVRVITSDSDDFLTYKFIKMEFGLNNVLKVWDAFVKTLVQMYPDLNFELKPGKFSIVAVKTMSDGVKQVHSSTSVTNPSICGALLGGALFGDVGAIIGGSRTTTSTKGTTTASFSDTVLVTVRYSNGFILDGTISKKSAIYQQVMVGFYATNIDN